MCTYNAISSHTDHFEIQKRDSEESLLTFVNLFPSPNTMPTGCDEMGDYFAIEADTMIDIVRVT